MEYIVRRMQKEDISQVQQVAKTSWNHTYKGIIPYEIQESFLKSAYNDDMMQKRLESSFLFVSAANSELWAFRIFLH